MVLYGIMGWYLDGTNTVPAGTVFIAMIASMVVPVPAGTSTVL